MPERYEIARASDAALIRLARDVLKGTPGTATFNVGDDFELVVDSESKLSDPELSTFGTESFLFTAVKISDPGSGFAFAFHRGKAYRHVHGTGFRWLEAAPFIDGIEISVPKFPSASGTLKALTKHLAFVPAGGSADRIQSPLEQASKVLDRVSDAALQVVEHTAERQRKLDSYARELEAEAQKKIGSERNRLAGEHGAKLEALRTREAELEKLASSLDDRANTHVRRELQKSMAALSTGILERPLLTSSQKSFSRLEFISLGFALILLVLAAFQSAILSRYNSDGPLLWFGEARVVLLGLGAGALILYALRQSASRHRQVSRWENDLNRFRLDTERASFLIEGDLEARKISENGLPEVMLDRFSRGLFTGGNQEAAHDGDDISTTLGHLVGRAALVKMGTDGLNIELKGAGVRKAQKDADKDGGGDD